MKRVFFLNIIVLLSLAGCTPESFEDVGVKPNRLEQIPGSYQLTKVIQSDVKGVKNNYPYKTLDITSVFPFAEFELTLTGDGGPASTFTTKKGRSPVVIRLDSGNWMVDNKEAPKVISFFKGTDTVKLQVARYTGLGEGKLAVRLTRSLDGKAVTEYDYEFSKK